MTTILGAGVPIGNELAKILTATNGPCRNVYMYGNVAGPMTENTPYAPCSKKGEIRTKIATACEFGFASIPYPDGVRIAADSYNGKT